MVSKEQIEKKLAQLQSQLEQARANLNAVVGAIQVCEILLKESGNEASGQPASTPQN